MAAAGYREPWTGGAKAYPEADTIAALWAGTARKRKPLTVHVAHAALAGVPCAGCGQPLDGPYVLNAGEERTVRDELGYAYVDVNPRAGTATAHHYYCAWGRTMTEVMKLRRAA